MKLSDLVTSNADRSRLSHTKLWSNIGYGVASYAVGVYAWRGILTAEMLLFYMAAVGASATASKMIAARYPVKAQENEA